MLLARTSSQRRLLVGIARLALDSSEQERLFAGFAVSTDTALQWVGQQAITNIQRAYSIDPNLAQAKEREGFLRFIDGRFDEAIGAFDAAEAAYPQFHSVSEIAALLRSKRGALTNDATRREVFRTIHERYNGPRDLLTRLDTLSRR
jgi:tetratricopeptide (TPR) repeat protein